MFKFKQEDLPEKWSHKADKSSLAQLLRSRWDYVHNNTDVFRYKISTMQERIVDKMYLLQLNPNRALKRRYPEQINHILQPFDPEKFNFTKVFPLEVLFEVSDEQLLGLHKILVNVSPISRYHSLLCPSINNCLPQILTEDSIKIALEIMFLCQDRDLKIGFNSLCAFASVNHLHFHMMFERRILPVEIAKCTQLKSQLYCFDNTYSLPAFCLEVNSKDHILVVASDTYRVVHLLLKENIAHNVCITRGLSLDGSGDEIVRVVIWPRKSAYGVKQYNAFNVAFSELCGWFPIYNSEDFTVLEGDMIKNELRRWQIEDFDGLCEKIKGLF